MGNKKSKPKIKPLPLEKKDDAHPDNIPEEKENDIEPADNPVVISKEKKYLYDPVFGRMVYNELVGAWVPAANEEMYEQSQRSYLNEREKNKKYLKTFNIEPEKISNYYKEPHNSFTIVENIKIKMDTYSYAYFLNDGRLAVNWDNELKIYSKDFKKIEQKIKNESTCITQLKDNSLLNTRFNGADIYKYNEKKKNFIFDYTLKCTSMAEKVIELSNERLALLWDNISIYKKENGIYVKNGNDLYITTMDDLIEINENEIASISGQESEITFWDLTTREIIAQIGDIENFGHGCLLLYDKSLIVGGANKEFWEGSLKYIYIINIDNKELIKKYYFGQNIWFMIKLNEKEFITGETKGIINRYRFEENEVKLMEKNEDHQNDTVRKLAFCSNSKQLASLSDSNLIIFNISE